MNISFVANGAVMATATLADNQTARAWVRLLPLELTLQDYAATEKIANLPEALPTADAQPGCTPMAGDLCYYAPWGNLAIFHKDFEYSQGLVWLGRLDTGIDSLRRPGAMVVRIEPA